MQVGSYAFDKHEIDCIKYENNKDVNNKLPRQNKVNTKSQCF